MKTVWVGKTADQLTVGMVLVSMSGDKWTIEALEPGDGPRPKMTVRDHRDGTVTTWDSSRKPHAEFVAEEECNPES